MSDKEKLDEALAFIKNCWENIKYEHEIMIGEEYFNLLRKIALQEGWK